MYENTHSITNMEFAYSKHINHRVHLMYLLLLVDLNNISNFSLGLAILASTLH